MEFNVLFSHKVHTTSPKVTHYRQVKIGFALGSFGFELGLFFFEIGVFGLKTGEIGFVL